MTQCPTSMFPLLGSDTFYSHCQYSAIYNEKQLCTNKNKGDHIPRYFHTDEQYCKALISRAF